MRSNAPFWADSESNFQGLVALPVPAVAAARADRQMCFGFPWRENWAAGRVAALAFAGAGDAGDGQYWHAGIRINVSGTARLWAAGNERRSRALFTEPRPASEWQQPCAVSAASTGLSRPQGQHETLVDSATTPHMHSSAAQGRCSGGLLRVVGCACQGLYLTPAHSCQNLNYASMNIISIARPIHSEGQASFYGKVQLVLPTKYDGVVDFRPPCTLFSWTEHLTTSVHHVPNSHSQPVLPAATRLLFNQTCDLVVFVADMVYTS